MTKSRMQQDVQRALRQLSDRALIDAMRESAPEAWHEFMARFRPLLIRYGSRTGMDRVECEAAVEQVLEESALRWAVDGAAPPENMAGYLLRALNFHRRTLERDAKRREERYHRAAEPDQPDGAILSLCSEASVRYSAGSTDDNEDPTQGALERLCSLLRQSLGEEDSKILAQLADGLPQREIAEELGLTYEAGRKRIQRLCARVRAVVPTIARQLSSTDRAHLERVLRRLQPVQSQGVDDAV